MTNHFIFHQLPHSVQFHISRRTLFKHQLAAVVRRVAADILLYVGVLVVVDPHALVPRGGGQPADQTGLPHRRLPLDQHRVSPGWDKSFGGDRLLICHQLNGEYC